MSETIKFSICPKCQAPIPAEAPQGLCPKCVLGGAANPTEIGGSATATGEIPSIARIAAAFPQLEILELIGRGGMGFVFKARQPHLDRYVALKLLPDKLASDPQFAERFNREGRFLAKLNHPNIVSVFDFGQAGGFYFLLMEYVDGVNLRQAMRAGRFSPAEALAIVPKICEALQYAHEQGVLHRDIKPENILLDAKGRVKIADFGIAKLVGEDAYAFTLTGTGHALGTPHYMAPEQLEKPDQVDHRADIYSLGVVFYEMLTGELPIGRFKPPSERTPLDQRVDEIVMRALERERELRQKNASEFKTQVERVTSNPQSPSGSQSSPSPIVAKWSLKSVWGAVLVGISLIPMIALMAFILYFAASHRGPFGGSWGVLLIASLIVVSLPAIAGTILGWMGLNDIHAHAGQRRGLPLAVFAALTWPLLLLIGGTLVIPAFISFRPSPAGTAISPSVFLALLVPAGVITFAIWAVYTTARWGGDKPASQRRGVLKWIFLALVLFGIGVIIAPKRGRVNPLPSVKGSAPAAFADSNTTPWIQFTFTAVELRETAGVRWLAIDYLDDVHGECQKSFQWETTIPGFRAETRTTEFLKEAKDSSPQLSRLRQDLFDTEAHLAELRSIGNNADGARVRAIESKIAVLTNQLALMSNDINLSSAVRHQRVEYRMPDSVTREQLEKLRDDLAKALLYKTSRLEMGERKLLFRLSPAEGGSFQAWLKVMPPLETIPPRQRQTPWEQAQSSVNRVRSENEEMRTKRAQPKSQPLVEGGASALQFRLVADDSDTNAATDVMMEPQGNRPEVPLRVLRTVLLDGSAVARAGIVLETNSHRTIGVELTPEGARQFGAITAANINRKLAIIIDSRVLSAPIIRSAISGGELNLSGAMSAAEARKIVAALNRTSAQLHFAEPVERSIPTHLIDSQRPAVCLDLDSGRLMTNLSWQANGRSEHDWVLTNGIDLLAVGLTNGGLLLNAFEMVAVLVPASAWDTLSAEDVAWNWSLLRVKESSVSFPWAGDRLPDAFLFRTRERGFGLLQILATSNDASQVKFRYKLVQSEVPKSLVAEAAFGPVRARFLYDYKSGKDWLLNLESGETFSLPPGMSWDNDAAAVWAWAHQRGIHVTGLNVASQHGLYGFEMKAAIVQETNATFETITPAQISAALKGSLTSRSTHNGGPPLHQLSGKDWNDLYAFATDEGRTGVLQVTGFVENPRGIKFRYKLVQAKSMERNEGLGSARKLELRIPTITDDPYKSVGVATDSDLPVGDYLVGLLQRPDGRLEEKPAVVTIYRGFGRTSPRAMKHLLWSMSLFESNRVREIVADMRASLDGRVIELLPDEREPVFKATNVHGAVTAGFIALRSQSVPATDLPPVTISIAELPRNWGRFLSVKIRVSAPPGYYPNAVGLLDDGSELETHTSIMGSGSGSAWSGDSCQWYFPVEFQANDAQEIARQLESTKVTSPNGIVIPPGQRVPVFSVTNKTGAVFRGYFELPMTARTQ